MEIIQNGTTVIIVDDPPPEKYLLSFSVLSGAKLHEEEEEDTVYLARHFRLSLTLKQRKAAKTAESRSLK
ncbi:hypothetical protein KFK09_007455 [Dendrobium nobile]|uniref:Uncharacterized protein n=1 Tax=Dendrobium nobile TaxID=94219 RepID=A0A8T3BU54_DENNO|nr:hypothetical protein KFK09_007455 [Dendrobium nobile]